MRAHSLPITEPEAEILTDVNRLFSAQGTNKQHCPSPFTGAPRGASGRWGRVWRERVLRIDAILTLPWRAHAD